MDKTVSFKFISKYNDYSNKNIDKIQWLKVSTVEAKTESKIITELTNRAVDEFYEMFYLNDKDLKKTLDKRIDIDRPILRYGATNINVALFIHKKGLKPENLYNTIDCIRLSSKKAIWHELFWNKPYVPKTVFTKKDALEQLTFPIIGKPSVGHSGIGIVKFSDKDSLQNSTGKYDLFSEWVTSTAEYRAMFVNDNICMLFERVPRIDVNKTVETKKKNEEVQFIYIEQDMSKCVFMQKLKSICIDMRKLLPLNVFSIDFLTDADNNIWVMETNSNSGLAAGSLSRVYVGIYRDFYMKDPPAEKMEIVNDIMKKYQEEIKVTYPEEYNKSKNPL